jgi:methylenetetrahydrofolate dehydrogenase (NADP+)/methenyltetrahydrofolate cyclohydrolase
MTATLIKGAEVAAQIREELKKEIADLKAKHNLVPGLVTVLVGADPASQVYVGQKEKTSKELGIYSERYDLPEKTTQKELIALVNKLNKDPKIHGILVQLPLPKHLNEEEVLYAIDPKKDVDGFHPVNVGKLMIGEPDYLPCTPAGIQQLLIRSGTQIEGAEVVVVGRSNIVGKPIANMLLQKAWPSIPSGRTSSSSPPASPRPSPGTWSSRASPSSTSALMRLARRPTASASWSATWISTPSRKRPAPLPPSRAASAP